MICEIKRKSYILMVGTRRGWCCDVIDVEDTPPSSEQLMQYRPRSLRADTPVAGPITGRVVCDVTHLSYLNSYLDLPTGSAFINQRDVAVRQW